jgi:hypothetical protein
MAEGIDYSFGQGLSAGAIKSGGKAFVCRYLAYLPNSKCINRAEFDNLVKAGLKVVLVWEQSGTDCKRGHAGGVADAREADRQATALGAHGAVIYFAPCDYDAPPGDQPLINSYLDGAASVIGHGRTGMYGGFWPLSRAFDGRHCAYGWQTYAWSGTNVDRRASLYQYHNGVRFGPAEVDLDKTINGHADYGQWPRPTAPAPAKPSPPPAPSRTASGAYRHPQAHPVTLADWAASRNEQVATAWRIWVTNMTAEDLAAFAKLPLPAGTVLYTVNP